MPPPPRRLALLAALLPAGCASTEEPPPARETLSFVLENDWFASSDDGYTNGVGITWVSAERRSTPAESLSRKWVELWSFLPFTGTQDHETYATWTIGHEMFTPEDITDPTPPPNDQPYAGVLFSDLGVYSRGRHSSHLWKVRVGIVGPASQADDVQKFLHDVIDDDEPRGWDTQLPNEPVLNVDYTFSPDFAGDVGDGFSWRLAPFAGLSAGTYFTGASASLVGECGWNLHDAVGLASLRRGVEPIGAISSGRQDDAFSFFLGGGGFLVGHYLPLDGTVFRASRSVETKPWVGFATTGLRWSRKGFSLGYQLTGFTDTFDGQQSKSDFGALTLTWSL